LSARIAQELTHRLTRDLFRSPGRSAGTPVSAGRARELILAGRAGPGLWVSGHLDLSGAAGLTALPPALTVTSLDVSACPNLRALPADLRVKRLVVKDCRRLEALPAGLRCHELDAGGTPLRRLPDDLAVAFALDLSGCTALEALPAGLSAGSLVLRDCTALAALPEGLDVCFLDISGCTALSAWPQRGTLRIGRLVARGCTGLRALPPWLTRIAQLDLRGCGGIRELPPGVEITSWLDVADSGLTGLPPGARVARLRWRGVPVEARVAFRPQSITAAEVLATPNVELRRVLLERMGYARFLAAAGARVLDADRDPGGERQLLTVPLRGDEPLVCVAVRCPSTGRRYIIRVPPETRTCRQAVAWIAGFDDPDAYRPVAET
jgi:hypothetical protein